MAGFGPFSGQTWPQDPFKRVRLDKCCRTHLKSAPEPNFNITVRTRGVEGLLEPQRDPEVFFGYAFAETRVFLALPPSAAKPNNHSLLEHVWFFGLGTPGSASNHFGIPFIKIHYVYISENVTGKGGPGADISQSKGQECV